MIFLPRQLIYNFLRWLIFFIIYIYYFPLADIFPIDKYYFLLANIISPLADIVYPLANILSPLADIVHPLANVLSHLLIFFSVLCCRDMNDNLIQYVPAALQSSDVVPALETLILSDNYLTFLKTGAFYNVSTLTSLYVLKTHDNFK